MNKKVNKDSEELYKLTERIKTSREKVHSRRDLIFGVVPKVTKRRLSSQFDDSMFIPLNSSTSSIEMYEFETG